MKGEQWYPGTYNAARESVHLDPLLRDQPTLMKDLKDKATSLVEEAVNLGGLDLEVTVPELVQLVLDDSLTRD